MTTNHNTTFHMKGVVVRGNIDMTDGIIQNVGKLFIGNWSFELGDDDELVIKNNDVPKVKLSNNLSLNSNLKYDRYFMVQLVNVNECIGFLVSATSRIYNFDMSQTPSDNQALPTIELSKTEKDSSLLGVMVGCEDYSRSLSVGNIQSEHAQEDDLNRVFVHSGPGTGSVWVVDIGGNINKGDYITTTVIPGYGMKQDDNIKHSWSGPRAMINCDFRPKIIVLEKPVDIDEDGPIYTEMRNINGQVITDVNYTMKYIDINGNPATSKQFIDDIQKLIDQYGKGGDMSRVLKNSNRKIFRACLIAYCY